MLRLWGLEHIRIYKILSRLWSENAECDSADDGKGNGTMVRLIDADLVHRAKFQTEDLIYKRGWNDALDGVAKCAPTAEYIVPVEKKGNDYMFDFMNAKPLIRCKDCKYGVYETYGEYGHYCCHDQYIETGEEFCAWAERKEDTDGNR